MLTLESCVAIDLTQLMMDLDRRYALYIQKRYHISHFTALQRGYCEIWGSPGSACVMRRHYAITYKQSLHAVNDLIPVKQVRNLLRGHPSYQKYSGPLEPISGYASVGDI